MYNAIRERKKEKEKKKTPPPLRPSNVTQKQWRHALLKSESLYYFYMKRKDYVYQN